MTLFMRLGFAATMLNAILACFTLRGRTVTADNVDVFLMTDPVLRVHLVAAVLAVVFNYWFAGFLSQFLNPDDGCDETEPPIKPKRRVG